MAVSDASCRVTPRLSQVTTRRSISASRREQGDRHRREHDDRGEERGRLQLALAVRIRWPSPESSPAHSPKTAPITATATAILAPLNA